MDLFTAAHEKGGMVDLGSVLRTARRKRNLVMREVADALGVSTSAVGQWERGQDNPSTENLARVCAFLGIDPGEALSGRLKPIPKGELDSMDVAHIAIRTEHIDSQQVASGISRGPTLAPTEAVPLPDSDLSFDASDSHDLPLYASVEGGPGEMVISSDPIGWLSRPRWLDGRDEAYAVRVIGTSMVPRYEPGEVVYVDPNEPLQREKDAIFVNDAEGEFRASIKRLVRWENHQWYIRQFNPPREGWWPKKRWPKAFRVMGRRD